jgi:subtilisin family serine protease
VTANQPVRLHTIGGFDSKKYSYSTMYWVAQEVTGAGEYWNNGITGKGVDVALLDTGVVEVNGLRNGKVVYGPDLSYEADNPDLVHKDTYGHGTHMAGIIAGRDDGAPATVQKGNEDHFLGMAPDSRVVSVKLADASGATDVSQVIAGIDWVVQNRNRNGLNIRVLNLSFGTDGVQDYLLDPLTYAVEVA